MTCDFCDEFTGGNRNAFRVRYGDEVRSRIVISGGLFKVLPSLGQITEGHVLIVPSVHFCALADMPEDAFDELEQVKKQVQAALLRLNDSVVFFEHGVRTVGGGGCGIDHAHMHAVPVAAKGVLARLQRRFRGSRIESLSAIGGCLPRRSSYLFFENASGDRFVFPVRHLPSQYMRQLIAKSIGKDQWDWRASQYEPELIATLQRLSPHFGAAPTLP
jgi:diadenosine tetraphosphate (Ap4A) HIT family hydrolase